MAYLLRKLLYYDIKNSTDYFYEKFDAFFRSYTSNINKYLIFFFVHTHLILIYI